MDLKEKDLEVGKYLITLNTRLGGYSEGESGTFQGLYPIHTTFQEGDRVEIVKINRNYSILPTVDVKCNGVIYPMCSLDHFSRAIYPSLKASKEDKFWEEE